MTVIPRKAKMGEVPTWLAWALLQETDECFFWPFKARTGTSREYGLIAGSATNNGKKTQTVQSFVCTAAKGACPDGEEARHLCGKGLCANKRHIVWSTHVVNESDKIAHGTLTTGARNGMFKMNQDMVNAIAERLRNTTDTEASLATEFGVSQMSINNVNAGIHPLRNTGVRIRPSRREWLNEVGWRRT